MLLLAAPVSGCCEQGFQILEKPLGSFRLLGQHTDACALSADLPSAGDEPFVLLQSEGDCLAAPESDMARCETSGHWIPPLLA
ncbi:hypothetical protein BIV25_02775 [Streptomyces sp. MUSC 14]|nr:hypothetical protein BIV25_02775 [Streptomyces sp. MUSC 14]